MASPDPENLMRSTAAAILWDKQDCLPLQKLLSDNDIIAFLTPVVVPYHHEPSTIDPFEPLGRAIAARHARVHHVPYTLADGITPIHVAHIKRARVVIFVISGPPGAGERNQAECADIAQIVAEHRPQVVIACFSAQAHGLRESVFPTLLQIPGYSRSTLEEAAALLFGERIDKPQIRPSLDPVAAPVSWTVEEWKAFEIDSVHDLWHQNLPRKFQLSKFALRALLQRDGYSKNYIVREPGKRRIVGFCATCTTFADGAGEKLIASLSMLLVDVSFRGRGIGRTLHDHALGQVQRLRGVQRLQLGSTFPRLFYGPPTDLSSMDWFRRRKWSLDGTQPGQGRIVCDWILNFEDWPRQDLSPAGLEFRACGPSEFDRVLDIVSRDSARKDEMGWYDQYLCLKDTMNMSDVILGLEGDTIVATALTYVRNTGNYVSENLPWAQNIGEDVGGITCICITGMFSS